MVFDRGVSFNLVNVKLQNIKIPLGFHGYRIKVC